MKRYAKQTALALAMALTVSSVAPATASAATKPSYKKTFNAVKKGKTLTYTVKNIKKGTKVKWSIIGTGKKYVSFNKSKAVYKENTKAAKKKTYSSNKVYVRKNTTKVVKAVVKATVTGKNGKKYTVSDKIAIAKKAPTPAATTPVSAAPTATAPAATATAPASAEPTTPAAVTTAPAAPTATAPAATATAPASVAPSATAAVTSGPATTAPVATTPATSAPETSAPAATTTPTVAPTATTTPSATPEVATAAAVSASAVNAKTIAVTFNRELTKTEQEGVKVSVTRDKATQAIKTEFKDAKTLYVTRDADVEFQAATYTVALTGTVEASYDVKVEAPVATKLSITSTVVAVNEKATVNVSLLDQYGAEMTLNSNDFTVSLINKTQNNTQLAEGMYAIENGAFVIDNTKSSAKKDDVLQLTLLHKTTGVAATATLTVVESTYVSTITLGEIEYPTSAKRITESTENVKIYYTAVNNYGDSIDLSKVAAGEYQIISTNDGLFDTTSNNIVAKYDSATKKTYFEIAKFGKVGKTTLVVMANKSGNTSKIDLEVLEDAGTVYAAEFAASSVEVAKGGVATVDVKLTDRYGDVVAAKDATEDAVTCVASNKDAIAAYLDRDVDSKTYGKLVIKTKTGAKEDSTVVLTATVNGVPTIISVKIGKTAVPSTIAVKADTTSLVEDATAKITFDVKDQYGNAMDKDAFNKAIASTGKKYTIAVTSKATDYVATGAAVDAIVPGTTVTATAIKADATSTTKDVEVKLMEGTTAVDTKTITFTIEPNKTSNLTYAVKEIPVLYKNNADVTTPGAVKAYAQEVVITAKKANGADVTIPASKILSVVPDSQNVVADKDAEGKWYVAGKDSATTITADVTAKLTVVVATDDGSTIVTANVTVSKDALQYNSLKLYDSADKDNRKETSTVNGTNETATIDHLVKVDQFGVEVKVASANTVSLSSYTNVEAKDAKAKFEDGKLTVTGITVKDATKEASFKATLVIGALTKTITVTIPVAQ